MMMNTEHELFSRMELEVMHSTPSVLWNHWQGDVINIDVVIRGLCGGVGVRGEMLPAGSVHQEYEKLALIPLQNLPRFLKITIITPPRTTGFWPQDAFQGGSTGAEAQITCKT